MRAPRRQTRSGSGVGLVAALALFVILCSVIGLLISARGPTASHGSPDDPSSGSPDAGQAENPIERALQHLDRATAALAEQSCADGIHHVERAQEVLRRANAAGEPEIWNLESGGEL